MHIFLDFLLEAQVAELQWSYGNWCFQLGIAVGKHIVLMPGLYEVYRCIRSVRDRLGFCCRDSDNFCGSATFYIVESLNFLEFRSVEILEYRNQKQ